MSSVVSVSEIPAAPYYVLSNDKFMSDWGLAKGKTNVCVVPCSCEDMARAVKRYVQTRDEQKYIRIVGNRPRDKSWRVYSLVPGWIERAREHSNLRHDVIDW